MKKLLILALFLVPTWAFASPVATFSTNNISHSIILNYAGYGVYGYNRFNYGMFNSYSMMDHEPNVINVKLRDHFGFDEHVVIDDGTELFGEKTNGNKKLGYGSDGFNKFGVNNIRGENRINYHK